MNGRELIRIGKISSINFQNGTARVTYEDKEQSTTSELPFIAWEYNMPEIGDQVLVAHLSNGTSSAVILGKLWHDGSRPSEGFKGLYRKEFSCEPGKAYERYDENNGWAVKIGENIIAISPAGMITITASTVKINGSLEVTGGIKTGNINLSAHTHTGADGETGTPH